MEIQAKVGHLFEPLIKEALTIVQEKKGNKEGAFHYELDKQGEEGVKKLAAKGVPRVISDFTLQKMIMRDEVYFNEDYT